VVEMATKHRGEIEKFWHTPSQKMG
jgi:hypothetical protein